MKTRIEKDAMGEVRVPADALFGAQTARAVENFPISGAGIGREMIRALATIKKAAAQVNRELGRLDPALGDAVVSAAEEVIGGELDRHFPVDLFQTGSGTSSNMNANEVIASRANQILGGKPGDRSPVHPNDHVNMGQSSNDVFPTAIHLCALEGIERELLPALESARQTLAARAEQFDGIVKIGRTHLQDAVPMRLGQELGGFASQLERGSAHLRQTGQGLRELALGGTAVGTGVNTHPRFGALMAARLSQATGLDFREAADHFEAQSARDAAVRTSGALKAIAVSLIKIADHIRWLASGPRLGLGELRLPEVQPGSSIMPGKVNPVIAESLIQAAAQVIGNDAAITLGGMLGHFQLNAMQPLIARNLLEQIRLLAAAVANFDRRLLQGLQADEKRIASSIEQSLALATALAPVIGYERAAAIAKRARAEGKTVREVAMQEAVLPEEELERLLDPRRQTEAGY
jgi:fumarate hydratase class II